MNPSKKILVTGATGLVGSYSVRALLELGHQVKILVREGSLTKVNLLFGNSQLQVITGDVHNLAALDDAVSETDFVLHCAAKVNFQTHKLREMMNINVEGTKNLINVCLAQEKPPHFIHISSIAAITGERNQTTPLSAQSSTNPDMLSSGYGLSKYLQELEVWRATEEGLSASIISPGFILGARLDGKWEEGSTSIFRYVAKRMPFYTKGILNYVDIKDVTGAIVSLVQNPVPGKFILVAGSITYQSFFEKVANAMAIPSPPYHLHPLTAQVLATLTSTLGRVLPLPPVASADALLSAQRTTRIDGSASEKQLGIQYESLETTISNTIASLRTKGLIP